jgi:iron complex transport system substrate-binding protein
LATSCGRLLLVLLAGLALPGCRRPRPAPGPLAVRDDAGRTVELARPARRVVALIPSVNETLLALGAGDRVIARTDYDRDVRLARLPSVGGGLTPNIEWLAARRPDLVVAWPDERARAVVSRLEAVGVPVFAARVESLGDAYRTTLELGRLLGLERRADTLVTRWRAALDSVRVQATAEPPTRVLYLIGLDPPEVAGRGTFVDELLRIAGGRNVFEDVPLWPTVSLEDAIRRDPDVVVLSVYERSQDLVARFRTAAGWRDLRAVRAGRVFWIDPDLANRPGPRAPIAARALFQALHPSLAGGRGSGRARTAERMSGRVDERTNPDNATAPGSVGVPAPPVLFHATTRSPASHPASGHRETRAPAPRLPGRPGGQAAPRISGTTGERAVAACGAVVGRPRMPRWPRVRSSAHPLLHSAIRVLDPDHARLPVGV